MGNTDWLKHRLEEARTEISRGRDPFKQAVLEMNQAELQTLIKALDLLRAVQAISDN